MKDRVHIRNAEAAGLARTLARQTGKTISDVVLDALRLWHLARGRSGSRGRRSAICERSDARVAAWNSRGCMLRKH
jgi:hypothetical protein